MGKPFRRQREDATASPLLKPPAFRWTKRGCAPLETPTPICDLRSLQPTASTLCQAAKAAAKPLPPLLCGEPVGRGFARSLPRPALSTKGRRGGAGGASRPRFVNYSPVQLALRQCEAGRFRLSVPEARPRGWALPPSSSQTA